MADDIPWYAPGHAASCGTVCKPRPRKHLWTLTKGGKRVDAQLLFHAEHGVEAQFVHDGVLAYAHPFPLREQALEEAEVHRRRLTSEGWRAPASCCFEFHVAATRTFWRVELREHGAYGVSGRCCVFTPSDSSRPPASRIRYYAGMVDIGRVFTVTIGLLLAIATQARSECVEVSVPNAKPLTKKAYTAQYELIFTGTVLRGLPESSDTVFRVDQVWKGKVTREMTMLVIPTEEGYPPIGRPLLVLARRVGGSRHEPVYDIDATCSQGVDLAGDEAQGLLKFLGPGKPPRH